MKRLLCSLLLLAVAGSAFAAPSVTGVSGTVSNGESITITGTDFGATGPTIQIFDDFEKGTAGNSLSTSAGSAQVNEWSEVASSDGWSTEYSTTYAHGGTQSAVSDWSGNYPTVGEPHLSFTRLFTDQTQIYYSWWVYCPSDKNWPGEGISNVNWKFHLVSGNPWPESDFTGVQMDAAGFGAFGNWYDNSPALYDSGYNTVNWNKGRWQRFEFYVVGHTSAGIVQVWELNSGTARRSIVSASGVATLHSGDSWDMVRLNAYARGDVNSQTYVDDVYIATGSAARARVEICNNATYTSATNCAIATPTSWGATSIAATVRQGSFGTSDNAYLFVIDSDGAASSGYAVTFGSGGETPPARKLNNITGVRVNFN